MATYLAHYRTPNAATERLKGVFEFESTNKAGSKANLHDARVHMLEEYGSEAISWIIESVELKSASKAKNDALDGQLQLDFREPAEPPKRVKRTFERGKI